MPQSQTFFSPLTAKYVDIKLFVCAPVAADSPNPRVKTREAKDRPFH
jgi:hypothetical protein